MATKKALPKGVPEKSGGLDNSAYSLAISNKEAGACEVIQLLLRAEKLSELWDLPIITRWEQEFSFTRGRADFVLFHIDGSISIVEVKDRGADRDVLGGIGQLSLYAIQAGYGLRPSTIRRILAVASNGEDSQHLNDACELAGVIFECIGPVKQHQDNLLHFLVTPAANHGA